MTFFDNTPGARHPGFGGDRPRDNVLIYKDKLRKTRGLGWWVFGFFVVLSICYVVFPGCAPAGDLLPEYDRVFDTTRIATFEIDFSMEDWQRLWTFPAEPVPVKLAVDGRPVEGASARLSGSVSNAKTSLVLRLGEEARGRGFFGVRRVYLHRPGADPSLIREVLALSLMRQAHIPAPRASLVWVVKNGLPWGIFTLVEAVNGPFLEERFGDRSGNLYRMERVFEDERDPQPDLAYRGDDASAYATEPPIYELRTNEEDLRGRELVDLADFIRALSQTPTQEMAAWLDQNLDLDEWLRLLSALTWLSDLDSYAGLGGNLFLYRWPGNGGPRADRRVALVPWDLRAAFGLFEPYECDPSDEACASLAQHRACQGVAADDLLAWPAGAPTCGKPRPLVDRALELPALRARYLGQLRALMSGPFSAGHVEEEARALYRLLEPFVAADPALEYSLDLWSAALEENIPLAPPAEDVSQRKDTAPGCQNGLDDDGDGLVDAADPGCESALDDDESGVQPTSCSDGADNDRDGWTDGADPDCIAGRPESGTGAAACNDGLDNDRDRAWDAEDSGCDSAFDDSEHSGARSCHDGLDNDQDGWSDGADPDCWRAKDPRYYVPGIVRFADERERRLGAELEGGGE